jgi:dTDP-4-dehydrorhamnose reductase
MAVNKDLTLLVFGAHGQVGQEAQRLIPEFSFRSVFLPSPVDVPLTNSERVHEYIAECKPQVVLNLAAYTAVDDAEDDEVGAFAVNATAAGVIASVCAQIGARLVHVSTDYVFAGTKQEPLCEDEPISPIGAYGRTKAEGERLVLEANPSKSLVVRTSSVHGMYGTNFVDTMLRLFRDRKEVSVVADQIMSPTWAGWLAKVLLQLCEHNDCGVLHACSGGAISWYEFACKTLELAAKADNAFANVVIHPVSAEQFPRKAKRPAYSVMDVSKLSALLGLPLSWEQGLAAHLADRGLVSRGNKVAV